MKEDKTPGIVKSIVLGGVAAVGIVIFTKTRNGKIFFNGKKNPSKPEPKPFDNLFNTSGQGFNMSQKSPSLISKQSKLKSILGWLLGRES